MSTINDGGPAFPLKEPLSSDHEGMTLRDYFAAKAMQGWLSNPGPSDETIHAVAQWSYRVADAMLKARSQQGEQQ